MALVTRPLAAGATAYFALAGQAFTLPSSGTVSMTAKPGSTDAVWKDIGVVDEGTLERKYTETVIRKPTPGARRSYRVLQSDHDFMVNLTANEVTPLTIQTLFGTANLDGTSAGYNIFESVIPIMGWLKVQIADSEDVALTTFDGYVRLKINAPLSLKGDQMKVTYEALVMTAANANVGSL